MDEGAGGWRRKRSAMTRENRLAGAGAGGRQAQITAASPSVRAWARQPPVGGLALPPAGGPYSSWYSRQKAPIWITSPSCSLRGASTLSLFTHTPLKEFVSWMA